MSTGQSRFDAPSSGAGDVRRVAAAAAVQGLYRVVKACLLHHDGNQAVATLIPAACGAISDLCAVAGVDAVSFVFADEGIFVNGQVLRTSREGYDTARELGALLNGCGLNEITLDKTVARADLAVFARMLADAQRDRGGAERLIRTELRGIRARSVPSPMGGGNAVPDLPLLTRSIRAYAASILVMRTAQGELRTGEEVSLDRVRRVAQKLVSLVEEDPTPLLSLAISNDWDPDEAVLSVSTAVAALAIARQLTVERRALSALATAALLYDAGRRRLLRPASRLPHARAPRAEERRVSSSPPSAADLPPRSRIPSSVPAPASVATRTSLPPPSLDRALDDDELHRLPASAAAALTALGKLHTPSMARTVILYEALALRPSARRIQLYGGRRAPTLLARVLCVARAFTELRAIPPLGAGAAPRTSLDEVFLRLLDHCQPAPITTSISPSELSASSIPPSGPISYGSVPPSFGPTGTLPPGFGPTGTVPPGFGTSGTVPPGFSPSSHPTAGMSPSGVPLSGLSPSGGPTSSMSPGGISVPSIAPLSHASQSGWGTTERTLVKLLLGALGFLPTGTLVELSTAEIAVVITAPEHPARMATPRVRVLYDATGALLEQPFEVDLAARTDDEPTRTLVRIVDADLGQARVLRAALAGVSAPPASTRLRIPGPRAPLPPLATWPSPLQAQASRPPLSQAQPIQPPPSSGRKRGALPTDAETPAAPAVSPPSVDLARRLERAGRATPATGEDRIPPSAQAVTAAWLGRPLTSPRPEAPSEIPRSIRRPPPVDRVALREKLRSENLNSTLPPPPGEMDHPIVPPPPRLPTESARPAQVGPRGAPLSPFLSTLSRDARSRPPSLGRTNNAAPPSTLAPAAPPHAPLAPSPASSSMSSPPHSAALPHGAALTHGAAPTQGASTTYGASTIYGASTTYGTSTTYGAASPHITLSRSGAPDDDVEADPYSRGRRPDQRAELLDDADTWSDDSPTIAPPPVRSTAAPPPLQATAGPPAPLSTAMPPAPLSTAMPPAPPSTRREGYEGSIPPAPPTWPAALDDITPETTGWPDFDDLPTAEPPGVFPAPPPSRPGREVHGYISRRPDPRQEPDEDEAPWTDRLPTLDPLPVSTGARDRLLAEYLAEVENAGAPSSRSPRGLASRLSRDDIPPSSRHGR
ncbi:hypothetical protein [Chondromyces crocatus]|uniref:Uncharacterized protein n=1 Tax=Chondromyces crocatus TaxID=52 RepID=A0A0K1E587_CHOCO|nr:hypothetical protein [Chondromyces crocatus]AKT36046.1 uncharacterized protein CMC5_001580 [Chondromyces crocatus]